MEAERELTGLKRLRYFAEQIESGNLFTYDAIVTEIRNFGMFVNLPKVQTIGLIPVALLKNDYYRFDPSRLELRGSSTGTSFRVGTTVRVQVARIDFDRNFLDFQLAPNDDETPSKPKNKRGNRPAKERGKRFNRNDRRRKK